METQIIKSGQNLVNTGQTKEFLKALYPVNYFLPYPLTDAQIEDWAKFIKKTEPEITPKRLDIILKIRLLKTELTSSKRDRQYLFH